VSGRSLGKSAKAYPFGDCWFKSSRPDLISNLPLKVKGITEKRREK